MNDQNNDYASEGDYRSSDSNVSLGFTLLLVGIAIGAVTALLIAPKTGKQMRRTLRRRYEDAREAVEDLGDQAGDWIDKGSDWADKAKSRVSPLTKPFRR
jgi:gas vesicle protein